MKIMANSLDSLKAKLDFTVVEEAAKETEALLRQMALTELREARKLTQVNLANILGVGQGAVSKLEKRTDMYLSSLESYVKAMGGQFRMVASFPDGEVEIKLFADLDQSSQETA
jgi:DNA-binding XRE family transcriptional regulator